MSVERRNFAWFALADAERCRLLCCRLTQQGTPRVEQHGILESAACENEQVQERTTGKAKHDAGERELRFANATAEWLNQNAAEHEMARLVVFASPRMLHLLGSASFYATNGRLMQAGDDMMKLQRGELADHPLILDVVRAPAFTIRNRTTRGSIHATGRAHSQAKHNRFKVTLTTSA